MAHILENVLTDARKLLTCLKYDEDASDLASDSMKVLLKKINSYKVYQENLPPKSEIKSNYQPKINLDLSLLPENKLIKELEEENEELKACLEEHQMVLGLIMSKYRKQINKQLLNEFDDLSFHVIDKSKSNDIQKKVNQINEMGNLMRKVIETNKSVEQVECSCIQDNQLLKQLQIENNTLQELLKINLTYGNEATINQDKFNSFKDLIRSTLLNSNKNDSQYDSNENFFDFTTNGELTILKCKSVQKEINEELNSNHSFSSGNDSWDNCDLNNSVIYNEINHSRNKVI